MKVVSIFWLDHFKDLLLETIIDGVQGGAFRAKLFTWVNLVVVNSINTIFKIYGGLNWQIFFFPMKSEIVILWSRWPAQRLLTVSGPFLYYLLSFTISTKKISSFFLYFDHISHINGFWNMFGDSDLSLFIRKLIRKESEVGQQYSQSSSHFKVM